MHLTTPDDDDAWLVVDRAGRIRHANPRFALLWQVPTALLRRRDDDAVLQWMCRSVADPPGYMRRLAQIDAMPAGAVRDLVRLGQGRVVERVAMAWPARGRPVARVFRFREVRAS